MPTAALRRCQGSPLCPHYQGQCPDHTAGPWHGTEETRRIRGRKLQKLRARLFRNEPLCRSCHAKGIVKLATIRDHIVPLAEGGKDNEANTQPLCEACNDRKAQQEAQRGKGRFAPTTETPRITVVCGPPGIGKTTYIHQHRRPGDLVWDLDAIADVVAQCPTFPRPLHVLSCLELMFAGFVEAIQQQPVRAFIIVADDRAAQRLTDTLSATLVRPDHRGGV